MSGAKVCARGCVIRGEHTRLCDAPIDFMLMGTPRCRGCLPRPADHGHLCEKCHDRLREHLLEAADLVAHLRSIVDPLKATVYSSDPGRGGPATHSPAPMSVDAVDAADHISECLGSWAAFFGWAADRGSPPPVERGRPFLAGTTSEGAFLAVDSLVGYILDQWPVVLQRVEVGQFAQEVLGMPARDEEGDDTGWTIAKAIRRFPMSVQESWAVEPCPACALRTVKVTPPRVSGQPTRFACESCGWEPPRGEEEFWGDLFRKVVA